MRPFWRITPSSALYCRARRGYIAPYSPLARLLLIKPQDEGLPVVHLKPEQVDA